MLFFGTLLSFAKIGSSLLKTTASFTSETFIVLGEGIPVHREGILLLCGDILALRGDSSVLCGYVLAPSEGVIALYEDASIYDFLILDFGG